MKKNKTLWSLFILIALIAVTFYYLIRNYEIKKLINTIMQINPIYLAAGLLFMFIFIASEGLGIRALLRSFNYRHSYLKCLKYSFLGFYYCSIMPVSGGQPVQIYYMNKDEIEVGDASLCIMLITICYQLGILLTCLFALILRYNFIIQNLGVLKYSSLLGAIINIVMVSLCITATFRSNIIEKAISFIISVLSKIRVIKNPEKVMGKIKIQIENFRQGASYVKSNPKILLMTLPCIVIQILSRLSVAYAVYRSFGLHGFGYFDILSLQAFLALGVEYLPIPGSVGVAEAGFYKVNSMIFGSERLMSATLLTRGISYYAFLLISGGVAVYTHISQTFVQFKGKKSTHKATLL
ncbi:MAG: lysylphosphatidylglycerol synthase transmembrane domain-containing protein [Bacillota bacterium]|nr:lysylphosphatidylglycerol synthase transmembrane domain-containing protein [Bacillota bacterium]